MKKTWLYGVHSVRAVLERRPEEVEKVAVIGSGSGSEARTPRDAKEEIAAEAESLGLPVLRLSRRELSRLTRTDSHQGIAVYAPLPRPADLEEAINRSPYSIVVLDSITDPRNLGAIARTAEAFGFSGLVTAKDRAAGISPTAHKASAGALEFLPWCRVTNLARTLRLLKEKGYFIYGAEAGRGEELASVEWTDKVCLVMGSEGKGLRPGVAKELDFQVRIPLKGWTRSLNVSAAFAIIAFVVGTKSNRG